MSEQVVIPAADMPAAPTTVPSPALPPEIAYLKEHGLEAEAGSLQSELEGLLQARDNAPATLPTASPFTQQTPPPIPVQPDAALEQPQLQTSQDRALDPYAVDGEDVQSVVIDAEGRARDAKTGKYVPVQALHRERDMHKQTRADLQATKEQNARVEERLAILNEILHAADDKPAVVPAAIEERPALAEPLDPEKDIFAWAKQQQDFAQKQADYIKKLEDKVNGTEQLTREQIAGMQADAAIRSDVTAFYAKTPDFLAAYNHLRNTRDNALKALGFNDENARKQQIEHEEKALASNAIKTKKSYASMLYDLAKAYGYTGPVLPPSPAPAVVQQPAAPQSPATNQAAAAKIESIRNGKDAASPTLNGSGGSAAEGLTVSQLANMSEAQFLDLAGKLGKAKLDSLLRGT